MTEADVVPTPPLDCEGYTLLEEIGRGGMGSVWRAVHIESGKAVAIKILVGGPLATEEERRRFLREADITRKLDHPGIVAVRELRESNGHLFLVMDFVEGETLARRLRGDPVPIRQTAEWLRDLADAVAHAHQRGVVHRDLKPGNILLDTEGVPQVADFGLAAIIDQPGQLTVSSSGLGTISYLAPEQAAGRRDLIGPGTDVHALGAVLFHCLTGRPPFVGDNVPAVLRAVTEQEAPAPRGFNPGVPRDLETICLKCLRKEPTARYQSAEELREDLNRFLNSEPIRARPLGQFHRLWRWCRRQPAMAALIFVSLVTLSVVAALAWQTTQKAGLHSQLDITLAVASSGRAESLFRLDETSEAIGELVRQTQKNTNDVWAVTRLLSALTWRNWPLPVHTFGPHSNGIALAAFTADSRRVVTVDDAGTIRIWDAAGHPVGAAIQASITNFNLSRETGWAVTLSPGGRLQTVRAEDGKTALLQLPPTTVAVDLSPKEPKLAVVAADQIEIWNLDTGQLLLRFPDSAGSRLGVFSADGQRLATANERNIFVWDSESGRRVATLTNSVRDPNAIRFTPDATGVCLSGASSLALLDIASHRELWRLTPRGRTASTAWSPTNNRIAIIHQDGTSIETTIIDGNNGRELRAFGTGKEFTSNHPFSPDGSSLLMTDRRATIAIQSTTAPRRLSEDLHAGFFAENAEFSPDGNHVLVGDDTSQAYLYDVRPGSAKPYRVGDGNLVVAYQISQRGDTVLTALRQGQARLWQVNPVQPRGPELLQSTSIVCVALAPDGWRAATGSKSGEVMVWNSTNGVPLARPLKHEGDPRQMAFSPDGQFLAIAMSRLKLWIRDLKHGATNETALPLRDREGKDHKITALQFDPKGARLLVASDVGVSVYDVRLARRLWSTNASVFDAAFSPDGLRVAFLHSFAQQASICDAATGVTLIGPLAHPNFTFGVAFDPLGESLFTTCQDGVVRVWNVADGSLVRTLSGHTDGIRSVHFSRDGHRMTTASLDNTFRIWDAEFGLPLSEFLTGQGGSNLSVAEFADNDRRLLAFSNMSKGLSLWPVETPPLPPPPWLIQLAQLLSGESRGDWQKPEGNRVLGLIRLRDQLRKLPGNDYYARWARWFFADRATRLPLPD